MKHPKEQYEFCILNCDKLVKELREEILSLKEINEANVSHIEAADKLCREKDLEIEKLKERERDVAVVFLRFWNKNVGKVNAGTDVDMFKIFIQSEDYKQIIN